MYSLDQLWRAAFSKNTKRIVVVIIEEPKMLSGIRIVTIKSARAEGCYAEQANLGKQVTEVAHHSTCS